jgi:hypothetical protein
MNMIKILKEKISWTKSATFLQLRPRAEDALDCAVMIIEAQEKRLLALEKELKGICHG